MSLERFFVVCMFPIFILCTSASFAIAQGKAGKTQEDLFSIIDVEECEGVGVTQCELAMDLITTLKMGEGLTCEEGFVHLRALDIAPGEDWSYEDPHRVVTLAEIKDVINDVQRAYNEGNVLLDGFAVAQEIKRFCLDMKGGPPTSSKTKKTETVPPPSPEGKK